MEMQYVGKEKSLYKLDAVIKIHLRLPAFPREFSFQ